MQLMQDRCKSAVQELMFGRDGYPDWRPDVSTKDALSHAPLERLRRSEAVSAVGAAPPWGMGHAAGDIASDAIITVLLYIISIIGVKQTPENEEEF